MKTSIHRIAVAAMALLMAGSATANKWKDVDYIGDGLTGHKLDIYTPDDFNWDEAMARLATLPRQAEWEAYVAQFQGCDANATSDEKWQMMERMFYLS